MRIIEQKSENRQYETGGTEKNRRIHMYACAGGNYEYTRTTKYMG